MDFFINNFQVLLLVFVRLLGLFVVAPFFSSFMIPVRYKILLTIFITIIIYPVLAEFNPVIPDHLINFGLMLAGQFIIGLVLGFIVSIIFTAFQLSAQIYHFQMGFGINSVFDPMSQIEIPILGQFQYLIAILVFISIRGHHLLLRALYESYEIIPIINFSDPATMEFFAGSLSRIFSFMFMLALKIAFPIVATMFLLSLTLGLLSKASPQMNIFMLGFPLQIGIGLLTLTVVMPYFIEYVSHTVDFLYTDLIRFMGAVK
ncbi:MAG: flagellar biosynthetic protein FliR [Spirochaetes bacterium]|nr:flagellar biosynthetic protein FliR [Spirochaetota bacterium]